MAIQRELEPGPGSREEDRTLVRRCLSGDKGAQTRLADRLTCVPQILMSLNERLDGHLSDHDLADLGQDTLVVLLGKLGEFQGRGRIESWAYRFCFLEFMNRLRYRSRWARLLETRLESIQDHAVAPQPRSHLDVEKLKMHLEALDPRERDVIRLKHAQDLTFNDIGDRLSISPNSAKTTYYRGLDRLRRRLLLSARVETEESLPSEP